MLKAKVEAAPATAEGDGRKLKMARRLRQETTMTLNWIAKRLTMGAAGFLANLLRGTERKTINMWLCGLDPFKIHGVFARKDYTRQ